MRVLKIFGPSLAKPKIKAAKEKCEHWPPQNGAVSRGKEPAGWLLACHGEAMCLKYGFGAIAKVRRRVFAPPSLAALG